MPSVKSSIAQLSASPLDYLKKFYADTAITGCTSGLMCAYAFFGADHIVFGSDMPLGSFGEHSTLADVVTSVEEMEIKKSEKELIFSGNATILLKLPTY